jgi:ligand-binding SRPBCC domain-containing protein
MSTILLDTHINAPLERVFDLARSIDLHMDGTKGTDEKVVAGRRSGLIGLGETVTWEARHFGVRQQLKSEITAFKYPIMFEDTMLRGAFKSLRHVHSFEQTEEGTLMRDNFCYEAPCGVFGKLAEQVFLTRYLRRFIKVKNAHLKAIAESDEWGKYLL